jgi:Ca-activated chloride channel family protein
MNRLPAIALALVAAPVLLLPQTPPPQSAPVPGEEIGLNPITLDVTRVNVLFTVTDRRGRFVSGLTRDDFEVKDNKKVQKILEFTAETDLPLRVALLIDTSNSVRDRFAFLKQAATGFLNTAMRPEVDKAAVVSFDSEATLRTDLTNDKLELLRQVQRLKVGGGTALYDAIFYAAREKLMKDQPRDKYRRALILLTDGEDTLSEYSKEQALEMAHKADTIIYAISTNRTHLEREGDKVLKYFAEETGGLAFFPDTEDQLLQAFANIENELRHQYNILYRPEELVADGKYHEIDIRVKTIGAGQTVVRARQGYYGPERPR